MKRDLEALKAIITADYQRHVKKFETYMPNKKIVLLGDSMIAYFPKKAFGLESIAYNLGIAGDTSVGVLNRINQVIKLKPEIVILNIGLNDFVLTNLSKEESLNNILEIRHKILESCPKSIVYIISLTPINKPDFQDQLYLLNRRPNDAIELNTLLDKHIDSDHFINIYDCLLDADAKLKLDYTKDGIHLNKLGYEMYYKEIEHLFNGK